MPEITVFADVSCPFAHVALTRLLAYRDDRGRSDITLRARAWALEIVNGTPLTGPDEVPKVLALQRDVAPDLFQGFDPDRFPASTIDALAAEAIAHRAGPVVGERFTLAVRRALFEEGRDIGDLTVLHELLVEHGLTDPTGADREVVEADHQEGVARGVRGSPHFFTEHSSFFCPTLDIRHDDDGYQIEFDADGFHRFVEAAFA